jgi:hypothetical protein
MVPHLLLRSAGPSANRFSALKEPVDARLPLLTLADNLLMLLISLTLLCNRFGLAKGLLDLASDPTIQPAIPQP